MNVELALEVKKRILAEPKKVCMLDWFRKVTKCLQQEDEDYKYLSCSTVGCIAGHTLFAGLAPLVLKPLLEDQNNKCDVETTAAGLLNLDLLSAKKLFFFHDGDTIFHEGKYHDNDDYQEEFETLAKHKPGTREYARIVAKAIDKCIKLNS